MFFVLFFEIIFVLSAFLVEGHLIKTLWKRIAFAIFLQELFFGGSKDLNMKFQLLLKLCQVLRAVVDFIVVAIFFTLTADSFVHLNHVFYGF